MKNAGVWLMIIGFGSMALSLIGYEFQLLMWIDNWGEMVGWGIRGAIAVAGLVLFGLGMREQSPSKTAKAA